VNVLLNDSGSSAACPWDLDGSGFVDLPDLTAALANWGACPTPPAECPWDLDDSGYVDLPDLTAMLSNWGPCPEGR
jgi:hypothetical protein